MSVLSPYERIRQENLKQNLKILSELGLASEQRNNAVRLNENRLASSENNANTKKPPAKIKPKSVEFKRKAALNVIACRRSERLSAVKKEPASYGFPDELPDENETKRRKRQFNDDDVDEEADSFCSHGKLDPSTYAYQKPTERREKTYGAIDGVPVGTVFQSRMECNYSGIHRPPVAGIHGGAEGAYSIVLSGGYEDDIDRGYVFTYTGEGGRELRGTPSMPKNLRTAPQSKDQCFSKGNEGLRRSIDTRNPVRVVRGYRLQSRFAPKQGYRYDGLYTVEKWWLADGMSGFKVFRFALKRLPNQTPLPEEA